MTDADNELCKQTTIANTITARNEENRTVGSYIGENQQSYPATNTISASFGSGSRDKSFIACGQPLIVQRGRGRNNGGEHTIAPTLSVGGYQHNNHLLDGDHIRCLTPLECWRLQGFPDWAYERAKAAKVSDTQLYRQAGNSVTAPVIEAIAKRLRTEEKDDRRDQRKN
jgi:site-specific DNA-cytosine methylase